MTVAADYDVSGRLAEGRPVADELAEYVLACRLLGHVTDDLDPAEVDRLYGSESGMQLVPLAADAEALTRLGAAADDVLERQTALAAALSEAWSGDGAAASMDFLARHQRASETCAAQLRLAADVLVTLRDGLWRAVDAKVAATIDVIAPHEGSRVAWLAAARTVAGGAGDRGAASELIDLEVKPFVDNDVRHGWVSAMSTLTNRAAALYEQTTATLRRLPPVVFDVPGGLAPPPAPPPQRDSPEPVAEEAPPVVSRSTVVPAAATPAPTPVMPASTMPSVAPEMAPAAEPAAALANPPMSGAPPGGLGGLGGLPQGLQGSSGLAGLGQQLADLIGGLTGSGADPALGEDPFQPEDPFADDTAKDEPGKDEPDAEPDEEPDAEPDATEDPGEDPAVPGEPVEEPPPAPTPVPEPIDGAVEVPLPPVPEPVPEVPPGAVPPTPCDIAADELEKLAG